MDVTVYMCMCGDVCCMLSYEHACMHVCMSVYVTNNLFEFLRFLIPLSCYNLVLITYVLKTYVPTKTM